MRSSKYIEAMEAAGHEQVTDVRELAARLAHGQRHGMDPDSMVAGAIWDGADPDLMAAARAMVPAPGSLADRLAERQRTALAERQRLAYLDRLRLRAETTAADVDIELAEVEARTDRAGGKAIVELRRRAAAARTEYLAALNGGPVTDSQTDRDRRRAARHAARKREPLTVGQRTALAESLRDGCTSAQWSGDLTPHVRLPRPRGLLTGTDWTREALAGTDARTGRVAYSVAYAPADPDLDVISDGTPRAVTPPRAVQLADGRPAGADLTHVQHGVVLVADGVTLAERDAQWDTAADAARHAARTRVRSADDLRAALMGGGMAEVRAELRAEADALLDMQAEAEAAAERTAAAAARSAADSAEYRTVAAVPTCGQCKRQHAAIDPCGAI